MNKKIIGILSAVTLIGGAAYLSGQGGFGGLSSSVLGGDACTQAGLDAQKAQYEGSSDQIASLEEQMSSLEDSISSAEDSIATYQTNVANKKQEIKNTNQEVNQLENYIRSQCGVKKQTRGGQVNYSAPDCNPKKNQVANKKQHINNLEKSVKDANNAIQAAQGNIQNQTSSLQQLENNIAEIEEFVEEYDGCEMTLASGSGGDVEVGIDEEVIDEEDNIPTIPETGGVSGSLPESPIPDNTAVPETGGDLPTNQITQDDASSIAIPTQELEMGNIIGVLETVACNLENLELGEGEFERINRELQIFSIYHAGALWLPKATQWGQQVQGNIQTVTLQIKKKESELKKLKSELKKLEKSYKDKYSAWSKMPAYLLSGGTAGGGGTNHKKIAAGKKVDEARMKVQSNKNQIKNEGYNLTELKLALQSARAQEATIEQYADTYEVYIESYKDCAIRLGRSFENGKLSI